jgi:hypothetical protein
VGSEKAIRPFNGEEEEETMDKPAAKGEGIPLFGEKHKWPWEKRNI